MKKKLFAYQHRINDYRRDTNGLTVEQHGVYRTLLDEYYLTGAMLPDDIRQLCRIVRAITRSEKGAVAFIVGKFFQSRSDGYLVQKGAEKELARISEVRSQNQHNADARWNKNKHLREAGASTPQCDGNANHEPVTSNHIIELSKDSSISGIPSNTNSSIEKECVAFWNDLAKQISLPIAQITTEKRRQAIAARLKDLGGMEGWHALLGKVRDSPFLRGESGNFRATIDWIIKPTNTVKIMEGNYDYSRPRSNGNGSKWQQAGSDIVKGLIPDEMERHGKSQDGCGAIDNLCHTKDLRKGA
jgi:uncharacterized protein YdaU (DUF1376 family)